MKNTNLLTVVLNIYKRANLLSKQLDALKNQSIRPIAVLIWKNHAIDEPVNDLFDQKFYPFEIITAECNSNLGVWARFAFALNAKTEYVCVLDDDVIPGRKWFENCIQQMKKVKGLYGTRGVRFQSKNRYTPLTHFGWGNPNEDTMVVDIVGHAWFFHKEMLNYYWSTPVPNDFPTTAGEDMHFSFALQNAGISTYVPPHPKNDREMWGNIAVEEDYGRDDNAISLGDDAYLKFDRCLSYYTSNGFELCKDKSQVSYDNIIYFNNNILRRFRLLNYLKKYKMIHNLLKKVVSTLRKLGIHL